MTGCADGLYLGDEGKGKTEINPKPVFELL